MDFELYGDDSRALIKFDPRTKLLVFFVSSLVSLSLRGNLPVLVLCTLECVMLILSEQRALGVRCQVILLFSLFVRSCIESSDQGAEVVVSLCMGIVSLVLFVFPLFVSVLLLVRTTRVSQFLSAFRAMHLPMIIVIPLAVMFRFIPTVQDEWNGVRKAMVFRGISMTPGAVLRRPFQTIEYILVPLLFSSINVMEELAAASLARGMDSERTRTSFEEVKLRPVDYLFIAIFAAAAIWILFVVRKNL
ncbi:energy-coupling factor transporter transmembrane component T [Olsenella uli]|uniref:energy-coupling factor transporter transmembrane component T n=2 Tax=Olsenella uli TaxID=133926 RepID=UPI00241E1B0F|nr:energy-coupling factor transporter transmembrane component T [Olsenella uli]